MRILALETSTEIGSCALWQDGTVRILHCPPGQSHSATLLPLVRQLLAEAGVAMADLDAIAFGAGPGAFTGLRVACGAAQGLAVALDKPVVPVNTLATMAWKTLAPRVTVCLDARMNEVYSASFERQADDMTLQGLVTVTGPEQVALPAEAGALVCGNALKAYPVLAARAEAAGLSLLPDIMPDAEACAILAVAAFRRGEGIDPALAAPLYVRDKVAQTVAERLAQGGKA